jgi:Heterokaryon incompatibility protein (HET)
MSQYHYSRLSLGPDGIRLLRLLPHEDRNAPIQCQLFDYSLQESGKRMHLYDALSYVWGDSDNPRSIYIGEHDLPVTENLHTALSHLRNFSLERIIWIDAICINQENTEEKEQQIQFMAKIYSQANRVLVWLGEAADDSDQALEEIRAAGGKATNSLNNKTIQSAVLALLQRKWFRRIWVREQTLDNFGRNY